ncbi:hypothetical protein [Demequina salsinemoris]|uniref:hypothetical protein n=1 Tax=Demequina salsinemoris TaxID=577470 RepID=UPI000783CECB|nr:hypothetical protein [Demequina salsinemoris]
MRGNSADIHRRLNALGEIIVDDNVLHTAPSRFHELLPRALLVDFASNIANDEMSLSAIASSAQTHPNSFRKTTLAKSENGTKLVLHRWLAPTATGVADLHSHRWNFVSLVLQGELTAQTFRADDDVDGPYVEYSYGSASDSDHYPMVKVGQSALSSVASTTYRAGSCYTQMYADVHQAAPGVDGALTLIVQSPPRQELCRVFMPSKAQLEGERPVAAPLQSLVRQDIGELIGLLGAL